MKALASLLVTCAVARLVIACTAPPAAPDAPVDEGEGAGEGEGEGAGEGEGEGDPDAEAIAPGAPIDVGAPPAGFATTPPAFAAGERCSTGQWWQFPDDEEEAFTMHPGRACIDCHAASGDEDAIDFAFAGTVMGNLRDEDDCRGVPGVQVELLDIDDIVFATATTNAAGNFGLCGADRSDENDDVACPPVDVRAPWRVRLTFEGRTREMFGHQDVVGDCMGCHTAQGENGAPGRVVVP